MAEVEAEFRLEMTRLKAIEMEFRSENVRLKDESLYKDAQLEDLQRALEEQEYYATQLNRELEDTKMMLRQSQNGKF